MPNLKSMPAMGRDWLDKLPRALQLGDGKVVTLDETLAHELSHAEDADTGTRSDRPACKGCATQKEVKAVQMQNQLRSNNPRTHFGNLRVPDSAKTPAKPLAMMPCFTIFFSESRYETDSVPVVVRLEGSPEQVYVEYGSAQ